MPALQISTNVSRDKVNAEVLNRFTDVVAETLGKPKSHCCVHIQADQLMTFAGTNEPCATLTLMSIGKLGIEENKKHSKAIADEMEKLLGVSATRMFIRFVDSKAEEIGYNKSTFHGIL